MLHLFYTFVETPPPGYISEDGETSDQQLNQSMDTGKKKSLKIPQLLDTHFLFCLKLKKDVTLREVEKHTKKDDLLS